jgi:bifunctional non-homologous end joining protein LigD
MTSRQMLAFVPPGLPSLVARSPGGDAWLHEVKHDGYRAITVLDDGRARIFTRRGQDYTARMPGIAEALAGLPCRSAVIDGEAVILGEDGVSDFFALRAALARRHAPEAQLVAFDLLHLDGEDSPRPPHSRAALASPMPLTGAFPALQLSPAIEGDGPVILHAAGPRAPSGSPSPPSASGP